MVKTQFDSAIRRIHSDNRTEFTKGPLPIFLAKQGIVHATSCVDTSQQNGRIERKNRHILNVARTLRFQASLPIKFRGERVCCLSYKQNSHKPTQL